MFTLRLTLIWILLNVRRACYASLPQWESVYGRVVAEPL